MREGIAIAGTIAVDEIKRIEQYPNKSELTTIKSTRRSIGGAVANCSVTLAKIDPHLPIKAVTLIGNDEKGQYLKDRLGEYKNIDTSHIKIIGDTPFTDVIQAEGDHSRTFFSYKGNSDLIDEDFIQLDKLNSKILHIAYILLLDSLDREDSKHGTKMAKVLKAAQDLGIKTSIDIVSENSNRYEKIVPPSLKYTNYCIINELEAGKTVGISLRNQEGKLLEENIEKVLVKLKDFGVKDWVVIHTPEGSFGYDGLEFYSIPSLLIEKQYIKGTVGAGDAYASGVLYGTLLGLNLPESMKIGTASAASSLLEEDSTSGVKSYNQLMKMYVEMPKRKVINLLKGGSLC
ncbi:carbohydrate kinase family protein [Bacillus sp. FJAT-50079]|uniref:carbohydrate kinase family protein n=1 Tax=Bacillus sp. FJAT-50079 TaxID=2833577 RepID=UPI001BC957E5|nr:carbohydrate kinase family protein [Bacillus sp. FJAT-50079]MBS4208303.1 carbohydrate kinase family protein [Bacillus sp. FJAT-50079]